MSEETAKRAIEFLVRCCCENAGFEVAKITVRRKTAEDEDRVSLTMVGPQH